VKAHCAAANITLKYSDCAIPLPSTSTLALDKMGDTGAAQGDAPQPKAFKAKPSRRRRPGAAKDIDISDLYFTYVPEPILSQATEELDPKKCRDEARNDLKARIHDCDSSLDSEAVAILWEQLVFQDKAPTSETFDGYKKTINLELERLDRWAVSWNEPCSTGDTRTGKEAFEATVEVVIKKLSSFELAATALLREQLQDAMSQNLDKEEREKEASIAADKLLNYDKLSQGVRLDSANEIRWKNRRQLRNTLEEILNRCKLPEGLELLDVVGFAAALETLEWNYEEELEGYIGSIQQLKNDVRDWLEFWDDPVGHVRDMTGRELIVESLRINFDGKFNTIAAPSNDAKQPMQHPAPSDIGRELMQGTAHSGDDVDNALAELGGWHDKDDNAGHQLQYKDDEEQNTTVNHDEVSSDGDSDFYDDTGHIRQKGTQISPTSPPSSPQLASSDDTDTTSTTSISLELPNEDMDTDQTFDSQVRDTPFTVIPVNIAAQQSFFHLPGISSDSTSAKATSAAPTQSSQAVAPHPQDHLATEMDDEMDYDEEQYDTAATLQPVSETPVISATYTDESSGDIDMSCDIPEDQSAHPAQVEKTTPNIFNLNLSADTSASSQNVFYGRVGIAKSVDPKPMFTLNPYHFASAASTTTSFRYQGMPTIDFADTSHLVNLRQRPVVPHHPLQQSALISPSTEEQQPELLAIATHPPAKDVGNTVKPESANETIATPSDMATRPEADEASIELEGVALSLVPKDGVSEMMEATDEDDDAEVVQPDMFKHVQSESSETNLQESPSPVDSQATPFSPVSSISDGNAVVKADSSPAQARQTPESSPQAQMMMNRQEETYQHLLTKLEATQAMLSNLQQSGVLDQDSAAASQVSALTREVAVFGVISEDVPLTNTEVTNALTVFTAVTSAPSMNTLSTASSVTNTLPTAMTSTNTLFAGITFAGNGSMNNAPLDITFKDVTFKNDTFKNDTSHTSPNTAIWKMPEPHEPLSIDSARQPPKPKSSNVLKNLNSSASKSHNKFVPPPSAGLLGAASGAQDTNVVGLSFKKAKSADGNSMDVVSTETASANNTFMITTSMDARSPRKMMAQPASVASGPAVFGPAASRRQKFQPLFLPTNIFDATTCTTVKADMLTVTEQQRYTIPKIGGHPDNTSSSKPPMPSGTAGSKFSFGDPSAPPISFMQNLPISTFSEVAPMASNPITRNFSTTAALPSSTPTKSVDSSLVQTTQLVLKKHTHKRLEFGAAPLEKPSILKRPAEGPTEKLTFPSAVSEVLAKSQVPASTSKHVTFAESFKEPAAAGNVMIEEKVAAIVDISSIEETTPPVPEADDKKNEVLDNADLSKPVIALGKTEDSNTQSASNQMQFMELLTMMKAIQISQKKAEQLLEVSLNNEKTHRDRCDTLAQELKDVKLQVQHDLDSIVPQKVLGNLKSEFKASLDELTKKSDAAQEESARRLKHLEKIILEQGSLIKKLGEHDTAPAAAPKEDSVKLEQVQKTISDQEKAIKALTDSTKAVQDEYTKKLERLQEGGRSQHEVAKKLLDRTNAAAAREEVVKGRELALAAQEEAFNKCELALAAHKKAIKQREQVPKIVKAKETAASQAQSTKTELTVQRTTVLAPSSTDLVSSMPLASSEAAAAVPDTKPLTLYSFSIRALSNHHLALLKSPAPSTSTPLDELTAILKQLLIPRPLLKRHASHLLAILTFLNDFNQSTIAYPTGFDGLLGKWCSNMRQHFKNLEVWLDVAHMTSLHDEMLLLQILVNSFTNVTPALKAIAGEHDVRAFAGMAKEYINAGRQLIANMSTGFTYRRGFEKWVKAEYSRCLEGVRRVQTNWMMIVYDDWRVEDEEL
jgi:hypothetical protein